MRKRAEVNFQDQLVPPVVGRERWADVPGEIGEVFEENGHGSPSSSVDDDSGSSDFTAIIAATTAGMNGGPKHDVVTNGTGATAWDTEVNVWLGQGYMDAQMLPYWDECSELPEHRDMIHGFHRKPCPGLQQGHCPRAGRSKYNSPCWGYHNENQGRRSPVDKKTGRLAYWDVPCPSLDGKFGGFCLAGEGCCYAHSRDEISYHPAKYKTRMCNGTDCRGEGVCCFAHGEADLRMWAPDRYSYNAVMNLIQMGARNGGLCPPVPRMLEASEAQNGGASGENQGPSQKHRFCASYPNISQCRRGAACAFAHTREEARTPLLSLKEENHEPDAMTEEFFTQRFKTLWCPIGAQHDWHSCVYAHTYQDARRTPSIGYGPQPCPYWSKKDTRAAYAQRCPLGIRCPYSHGAKEQLYHPKYFRTVICRDLQVKGCPRRRLCAFFHRRGERRNPPVDDVDYSRPIPKSAVDPEWANHFNSPPFFQETSEADGGGGGGGDGAGAATAGKGGGGRNNKITSRAAAPQQQAAMQQIQGVFGTQNGMGQMDGFNPMLLNGMDQMPMLGGMEQMHGSAFGNEGNCSERFGVPWGGGCGTCFGNMDASGWGDSSTMNPFGNDMDHVVVPVPRTPSPGDSGDEGEKHSFWSPLRGNNGAGIQASAGAWGNFGGYLTAGAGHDHFGVGPAAFPGYQTNFFMGNGNGVPQDA